MSGLCNVDVFDLTPINRISSHGKLGLDVMYLNARGSDAQMNPPPEHF